MLSMVYILYMLETPCVATLHRVFKGLDVAAFEAEVGNWLANSGVEADDPLSLDGKTLRGVHGQEIPGVHLVSTSRAKLVAETMNVAIDGLILYMHEHHYICNRH